jgi:hypothetical protein
MNLSFSTKLCIVACHSDTSFKKQIIKHNHPILKKVANTIYINSSKYDKTIPMIHTSKLDKYDKYKHILSTVNLRQYNLIIWMTDELLLTFSLVPFFTIAIQRGYHEYKDMILQTPNYYLNPFPVSKINITPAKEDPSLFKSDTILPPIHTNSTDTTPLMQIETFTINGTYTPSATIQPIHTTSNEPNQPTNTFKLSTVSNKLSIVSNVNNAESTQLPETFTMTGSYTPSATILPIHTTSNEPLQSTEQKDIFKLSTVSNKLSIVSNVNVNNAESTQLPETFTMTGTYTPSTSILPIHTTSNEPLQSTEQQDIFKLSTVSNKLSIVSNVNVNNGESTQLPETFKLTNNRSYNTKPVVTGRPNSQVKPIDNKHMFSKTIISFTNVLFSNKSKPIKKVEKNKSKTWVQQLREIRKNKLPERIESTHETILISFNPLPYLEYSLRKMIFHLPQWSHTIVCGNINTELITSWNLPIHVISLDIDTITPEQYNELVLMPSFWELFEGETLLLYQEDSKPLEYSMDSYLLHMYKEIETGITIRNKAYVINYLNVNPPEEGMSEQLYFKQYAI